MAEKLQSKASSTMRGLIVGNHKTASNISNNINQILNELNASTYDSGNKKADAKKYMVRRNTTKSYSSSFKAISREHTYKNYVMNYSITDALFSILS